MYSFFRYFPSSFFLLHPLTNEYLPGVYLTDLTFIEDGIPSLTPSGLINFSKRTKTAEVIRDIQQYQNVPYLLHPVSELQDYILNNLHSANDVHDMYERSLEVEPRERDDEKIARYAAAAAVNHNFNHHHHNHHAGSAENKRLLVSSLSAMKG